jgi:hypothetical protein
MRAANMERKESAGILSCALALLLLFVTGVESQTIRSEKEIARIVVLEQVAVQDGVVQGLVRNTSNHALADVQLFIRYTWLWDDERNPGTPDPGTSTYHTLKETIQPNSTVKFVYKPSPPLSTFSGGRFDTSVKVAGFTEIIPQK